VEQEKDNESIMRENTSKDDTKELRKEWERDSETAKKIATPARSPGKIVGMRSFVLWICFINEFAGAVINANVLIV
jgi:hypothetical protein